MIHWDTFVAGEKIHHLRSKTAICSTTSTVFENLQNSTQKTSETLNNFLQKNLLMPKQELSISVHAGKKRAHECVHN